MHAGSSEVHFSDFILDEDCAIAGKLPSAKLPRHGGCLQLQHVSGTCQVIGSSTQRSCSMTSLCLNELQEHRDELICDEVDPVLNDRTVHE